MSRRGGNDGQEESLLGDKLRPNAAVSVIRAAKASLKEPSRPFTPTDAGSRHLFGGSGSTSGEFGSPSAGPSNRPLSSFGHPRSSAFFDAGASPKLQLPKLEPMGRAAAATILDARANSRDSPLRSASSRDGQMPAEVFASLRAGGVGGGGVGGGVGGSVGGVFGRGAAVSAARLGSSSELPQPGLPFGGAFGVGAGGAGVFGGGGAFGGDGDGQQAGRWPADGVGGGAGGGVGGGAAAGGGGERSERRSISGRATFTDADGEPLLDPDRNDDLPTRPNTSRGRVSSRPGSAYVLGLGVDDSSPYSGPAPQRRMGAEIMGIDAASSDNESETDDSAYRHLYSYNHTRAADELADDGALPPPPGAAAARGSGTTGSSAKPGGAGAALTASLNADDPVAAWRANVEETLMSLAGAASAYAGAPPGSAAQRDATAALLRHTSTLSAHVEYMRRQPHSSRWLQGPCALHADSSGAPLTVREAISEHVFRLMDSTSAELLLKGVGILLRVVKSRTPLLQASKLLYRLSKETANDALIRREKLLDPILRTVVVMVQSGGSGSGSMHEPLVFLNGCLKNVSNDAANQRALVKLGALKVLTMLLEQMASQAEAAAAAGGNAADMPAQVVVQVTGVLRNLAVAPSHAPAFASGSLLRSLRVAARAFVSQPEAVLNVGRILSKLSLHEECQAAMEADPEYADLLLSLLEAHTGHRAIVLRVAFVLGNLTTHRESYRAQIAALPRSIEVAVSTLAAYSTPPPGVGSTPDDAAPAQAGGVAGAGGVDSGDSTRLGDRLSRSARREEVVVKLLRVVANLAIDGQAGPRLAADPCVSACLVSLLQQYTFDDEDELVLNCVAAATNLSFYHGAGNRVLGTNPRDLLSHLTPLMMCDNEEAQVEAARAYGNFSRVPAVREYMQESRVLEAMLLLLDHNSLDLLHSVAGTLINFTLDSDCRSVLIELGGPTRLVEVAERIAGAWEGSDAEADALLASLKALSNAVAPDAVPGSPLPSGAAAALSESDAEVLSTILDHVASDGGFREYGDLVRLAVRFQGQLSVLASKLRALDLEPL
ncbi:hypothetical protein FOA52_015208 [Chlamydomonas sp. UWO 241]|nr:hypothetical protein FOA52_015208 [Chlamydomonas sp. UWO 241]